MPDATPTPGHLLDGAVSVPDLPVPQGPAPGAPSATPAAPRCNAEYQPHRRERGQRLVMCDRPSGHFGDHYETVSDHTWPAEPDRAELTRGRDEATARALELAAVLDQARTEIADLRTELGIVIGQASAINANYEQTLAELAAANRDLDHARRERDATRAELAAATARTDTYLRHLNEAHTTIRKLTAGVPIPAVHVRGTGGDALTSIDATIGLVDQARVNIRSARRALAASVSAGRASEPDALRDRLVAAIETAINPSPDVTGCPGPVAALAADAVLAALAQTATAPAQDPTRRPDAPLADVRAQIARRIRAELVCCDVYDRHNGTEQAGLVHPICFWGEAAARIAEDAGRPDAQSAVIVEQGAPGRSPADRVTDAMAAGAAAGLATLTDAAPDVNAQAPETTCRRCGRPNVTWSAPSPLWNAVMRGGSIDGDDQYDGIVCPCCFAELAEQAGIARLWRLHAETATADLETTTPSGRVWDDDAWLWRDPAPETATEEDDWAALDRATIPADARCPSRIAHHTGAVLRCLHWRGHTTILAQHGTRAVLWDDTDDRLIADADTTTAAPVPGAPSTQPTFEEAELDQARAELVDVRCRLMDATAELAVARGDRDAALALARRYASERDQARAELERWRPSIDGGTASVSIGPWTPITEPTAPAADADPAEPDRSATDRVTDAMAAGAAAGLAALSPDRARDPHATVPAEAWDHRHPDHGWWVDGAGGCRDGACPDHQPHTEPRAVADGADR